MVLSSWNIPSVEAVRDGHTERLTHPLSQTLDSILARVHRLATDEQLVSFASFDERVLAEKRSRRKPTSAG
jgi:hypothetical protein